MTCVHSQNRNGSNWPARKKSSPYERLRKSSLERDRAKAIAPLVRRVTESLIGGAFLSGWPVTNGIEFFYLSCEHRDHADINAAKNILALGLSVSVCGEASSGVLAKSKTRNVSVKQKTMDAQDPGIIAP